MKRHMLSGAGTIFTVMALLCLIGCERAPMPVCPRFTYEKTYGPYPKRVVFHNDSKYSDSIEWDFGDDTLSHEESPVKYFNCNQDTITVKLTASGEGGVNQAVSTIVLNDSVCRIEGVTIYGLPATKPTGAPWDPTNGPDVMMTVYQTPLTAPPYTLNDISYSYTSYNVTNYAITQNFRNNGHDVKYPNPVTSGKGIRYIQFWDEDLYIGYELMGTIKFDITEFPCNATCGSYYVYKDSLGTDVRLKLIFF